jgi:molecular chaperone DnaK
MMFQAEALIKDNGDKIPDDLKSDLEAKIADMKDILENDRENIDRIKPASDALMESLQKAGSAMYEAAGAAGGADMGDMGSAGFAGGDGSSDTGAPADDEATVEGEFREVGDDENRA